MPSQAAPPSQPCVQIKHSEPNLSSRTPPTAIHQETRLCWPSLATHALQPPQALSPAVHQPPFLPVPFISFPSSYSSLLSLSSAPGGRVPARAPCFFPPPMAGIGSTFPQCAGRHDPLPAGISRRFPRGRSAWTKTTQIPRLGSLGVQALRGSPRLDAEVTCGRACTILAITARNTLLVGPGPPAPILSGY